MINNRFVHFDLKTTYESEWAAGNISEQSIVLIKDTKEIYKNNSTYGNATTIDLSGYVTDDELETALSNISLDGYVTDSELTTALSSKEDIISDLEIIRSGALLGATAIQEHQDISGKLDTDQVSLNESTNALTVKDVSTTIVSEINPTFELSSGISVAEPLAGTASAGVITVPYATDTQPGVVKIGDGLRVDSVGTISVTASSSGDSGTSVSENGVYIVDTSGKAYSADSTSVTNAAGVAVVTDNCCFVMGLEYTGSIPWLSSSYTYDYNISDVPTSTSSTTAATYYDGPTYTDAIVEYADSQGASASECAAKYVRSNYSSFLGVTPHLGSSGEWQAVLDNYTTVQTALTNAGGFTIDWDGGTYYWTSCEYSSSNAWSADFYVSGDRFGLHYGTKYCSYSYHCTVPFWKVDKSSLTLAS